MGVNWRQTGRRVNHLEWLFHANVPQTHVSIDAEMNTHMQPVQPMTDHATLTVATGRIYLVLWYGIIIIIIVVYFITVKLQSQLHVNTHMLRGEQNMNHYQPNNIQSSTAVELICKYYMVAWRSGNIVRRINEVALRRARLVLGWVTVFGRQTTSVFHQATQANSASYPQRDGKWVPAKVRWCSAAGEQRQVWFIQLVDKRVGGR